MTARAEEAVSSLCASRFLLLAHHIDDGILQSWIDILDRILRGIGAVGNPGGFGTSLELAIDLIEYTGRAAHGGAGVGTCVVFVTDVSRSYLWSTWSLEIVLRLRPKKLLVLERRPSVIIRLTHGSGAAKDRQSQFNQEKPFAGLGSSGYSLMRCWRRP